MSRKDVECPYCEFWNEINHDDGAGHEEGVAHTQECCNCEKIFVFYTSLIFNYSAKKAPCQNGEAHKLKPIIRFPVEFAIGKARCEYCQEEIMVDEEAHKKALEDYKNKQKGENLR
jgi:hypothetical protein